MSEQYYQMEDVVPNTPEQAIENIQAQSNSLANVVPEVATALNQTGEALGQLYEQAKEAGNTGAMALISAAWERTEQIANQVVQFDALKQSALEAITTINEERQRVTEALGELEEALSTGDELHPMLREYADDIRTNAVNEVIDEVEAEAFDYAGESIYDQMKDNVAIVTGIKNWQQINRFIGILQGDYEVTDLQSAQLKAFIESLSEDTDS